MADFSSSIHENERQKLMSAMRRLAQSNPGAAAEATFNLRLHSQKRGKIYVHGKRNKIVMDGAPQQPAGQLVDYVDLKVGETRRLEGRMDDYARDCVGETLMWAYCYETDNVVLLERLVHLTLMDRGAKRNPYPCPGCGVQHRELFAEFISGGLDGIAGVIEMWLARLGEPIVQIPLYERK